MKKILALAVALFASNALASVASTPHDLTAGAVAGTGVCQFCHMPHNANTAVTAAPIWSRTIKASSQYTLKTGSTYNLDTTQYSLLCLSCHDGTIAMGTLYNGQVLNTTQGLLAAGNTNLGTILSNDHPVGAVYPATGSSAASTGLAALTTATGNGYAFFGGSSNMLECGSCHDPHNNANLKFYRTAATDRCIGCHATK